MPVLLKGSCRCGAVNFEVKSHTPAPFMLCYCSICRKQQGGGGYAINLGGISDTLKVTGKKNLGVYRAEIVDERTPARRGLDRRAQFLHANAAPRSGSTTRPGRISCIPSPRPSTASCRSRRSGCTSC